jgi:hypothetical protein
MWIGYALLCYLSLTWMFDKPYPDCATSIVWKTFGQQTFGQQTFGQQTFGQQTFGQQTFS